MSWNVDEQNCKIGDEPEVRAGLGPDGLGLRGTPKEHNHFHKGNVIQTTGPQTTNLSLVDSSIQNVFLM